MFGIKSLPETVGIMHTAPPEGFSWNIGAGSFDDHATGNIYWMKTAFVLKRENQSWDEFAQTSA